MRELPTNPCKGQEDALRALLAKDRYIAALELVVTTYELNGAQAQDTREAIRRAKLARPVPQDL